MHTYEFSYRDNEGDLFSSGEFTSLADARAELARLRTYYNGDFTVMESWKYVDGVYKGSWY